MGTLSSLSGTRETKRPGADAPGLLFYLFARFARTEPLRGVVPSILARFAANRFFVLGEREVLFLISCESLFAICTRVYTTPRKTKVFIWTRLQNLAQLLPTAYAEHLASNTHFCLLKGTLTFLLHLPCLHN